MIKNDGFIFDTFLLVLEGVLKQNLQGISEYDLIINLKEKGYFEFLSKPISPAQLFQAHFLLFHTLYLLHDELLQKKEYFLDIQTLKIQLLDYKKGEQALQLDNKLRAYYLDFSYLQSTSEEDVYELLASFWNKYNKFDSREDALFELGLQDPIDDIEIKKEYRRLIMKHHPDRGGETEKLQKLNDAIKMLLG